MLAGFWRMSMLGREVGMAFLVGDMMWTETQAAGCPGGVGGTGPGWIRGVQPKGSFRAIVDPTEP